MKEVHLSITSFTKLLPSLEVDEPICSIEGIEYNRIISYLI